MEIKKLQSCDEEIINKENDQSADNFNFSSNNEENLEQLFERRNSTIDSINHYLSEFFSIRLAFLEESLLTKEIDVTNLMFKLHSINLISNEMKVQLPVSIIEKRKKMTVESSEEDLNSSKMSTVSRRSNSSSRSGKKDFLQPKTNPRDKMALFSPKVAINIMFNKEKDGNNSSSVSVEKSVRKNSDTVKKKGLISNSNLGKTNKEDDKISANKKIAQSPINPKDKNKVDKNDLQENKNGLYKQNARKVKSDGDNLVKKNSDNVSSNHIVSIKSSNINKPKLTLTKGLSNEKSNKVNHNQATASQNLNNSELSPKGNLVNNIGVNNYNSLSYLPGKTNTEKKDQAVKLNNNNNSKTIELLKCQNNSKSNYKLEPKAKKYSLNSNNLNNSLKINQLNINNVSVLALSINELIDSTATRHILKYLLLKEKIIFKNLNQKFRKLFFNHEINELSNRIKTKKLEENPCYFITLPLFLEESVKNNNLCLSNHLEIYNENPSFNNLVNFLYTIAFTKDKTFSKENQIKNKFLYQKVEDLNTFISQNNKSQSIYSVLPLLMNNLRLKNEVYLAVKELFEENEQSANLRGLTAEFIPFSEILQIISKCIKDGPNMEIVIDLEILSHKLEILKTYLDQK